MIHVQLEHVGDDVASAPAASHGGAEHVLPGQAVALVGDRFQRAQPERAARRSFGSRFRLARGGALCAVLPRKRTAACSEPPQPSCSLLSLGSSITAILACVSSDRPPTPAELVFGVRALFARVKDDRQVERPRPRGARSRPTSTQDRSSCRPRRARTTRPPSMRGTPSCSVRTTSR